MIEHVVTVDDTGDIKVVRIDRGSRNTPEGRDDETGLTTVYLTTPLDDITEFIELKYWNGEEFVSRAAKPNVYASWDGDKWTWDHSDVMKDIRHERDILLYRSDWSQLADAKLTDDQKQAWRDYRQDLRDITEDIDSDIEDVSKVVWPEKP